MNISDILFSLLRFAVCSEPLSEEVGESINDESLEKLYKISKSHDMAHLVAAALAECESFDRSSPYGMAFFKMQLSAVKRYERINYELGRVHEVLSGEKIPFIPLKGTVIRKYYPEPWMRTSSDIDILVRPEDLEKAVSAVAEKLDYRIGQKTSHDENLFSPIGVHLELHYDLIESGRIMICDELLENIWEYAFPTGGYEYELSDEMYYFYHLAHMAKHITGGGCGIRPFMDLWVLEHRVEHSDERRDVLLREGGLYTFAVAMRDLSKVWFENAESNELSQQLSELLLKSGAFGNVETSVTMLQARWGGKGKFVLSRVFPPVDTLKCFYPVLEKHKWLLPVCYVRRWITYLSPEKRKKTFKELGAIRGSLDEKTAAALLEKLEI